MKMNILPKATYRFNAIPIESPMAFFTELGQTISEFVWIHKRTRIEKAILRKKKTAEGINFLNFRLYYKVSHQHSMVLPQKQKYRPVKQDRKPKDKPIHLWAPYLRQRRKDYTMEKRQENWTAICKRMKLEHFLISYTKKNSKWVKNLNVRQQTIKLLEENVEYFLT